MRPKKKNHPSKCLSTRLYCIRHLLTSLFDSFQQDCKRLQETVRHHIKNKLANGVFPILGFSSDRAHEVLALMLDPRYCRGQTFQAVHNDPDEVKALWKRYTEECLVPSAVRLAIFLQTRSTEKQPADNDDSSPKGNNEQTGIDDSDDDTGSELGTVEITRMVEAEVRLMRKAKDLPSFADKKVSPLQWWADHATMYPSLAELARIVLGIPGSQIECERVFSLAGLLTSQLRNRMSPENLSSIVFVSKNLNLDATLDEILAPIYGERQWELAKESIGTNSESARNDAELFGSGDGDLNWSVMESLLEDFEPLIEDGL